MSWRAIARNDLRGARNERGVWGLFVGFLLVFGGLAALLVQLDSPDFEGYLDILAPGVGLLVPLAALVLGYDAIVGERESGTAKLSLSMPHSRAGMVVGILVSRTTLFVTTLATAASLTGLGMAVTFPAFDTVRYTWFLLATSAYGTVFLWLAGALSMALSTSRRVIAVAFGTYLGLTLFWDVVIDVVVVVLFRFRPDALANPTSWATFAKFVGPRTAFDYLIGKLLHAGGVPPVTVDASEWFISPWIAILALTGWSLLPVIVGYTSFRRADL